jgi:hypothetical protein
MLPGYMGCRSLLSSRCVSYHQGQLAATRQMVPTWMVPPPPTASLRWPDRGWLGASAIRRLGRRQVVGSNWQRLTKSLAKPTNRGVVVSAQGIREALEARASLADRMQHIHCHRRTPLSFKTYAQCNSVMNQPQRDRAEVLTFVQRADAFPCHRRSHPRGPKFVGTGARSRALRTMRDFWLYVQPQARETSRSALPGRLRQKGRNADTQRQKGVVIGRENPSGGIIASEFADLAACWQNTGGAAWSGVMVATVMAHQCLK